MAVTKLISSVSQNAHTCIQCGKIFRNIVKYIIHKSRHERGTTFITNIRKKYLSYYRYRFCWKRYHVCNFYRKVYNCAMCQKSFISEKTVVKHLKNCPFNTDHKCLFCDYTSSSQSDIINHSKQHTDEQPYECTKCEKKFVSLGELTDHEQVHLSLKYMCFTCGMAFADKNVLKKHLEDHRGKYLCPHCGRGYAGRDHFYHTEVIELSPCKECGLSFQYLCMYEKHKRMHGETVERSKNRTKNLCEQCGKEYSSKDYIFHKDLEDELSPCKICGLRFDYICVYEKHVKEHMEALENIKTCKTKADLCQYIECAEVVTSQDPLVYGYNHVCMLCGKRYKELQSTLVHMEMHLKTELGVNENEAFPSTNFLEPMDTSQGIGRNWNSNLSSGLETAFDAVMKRNSKIESDLQSSRKPKKGNGLKLPRNDNSVGLNTKGLPCSSANLQVAENVNGNHFKVNTGKVILAQHLVSPNKSSPVTNKNIVTFDYRTKLSEISKKNQAAEDSKIEPPLAEFLGFENICPSVYSTSKDAAINERSSIVKSQNDSDRKVSSNEKPCNKKCKDVNYEGDISCVIETVKLNKTASDVQEHKYAGDDKCVPVFHNGHGDNSELVQVFKSLEPILNNLTVRDFDLGDIQSYDNGSQADIKSEVAGQDKSVKNNIEFPFKDGKVKEEFITKEALVDDPYSAFSLEESFSGTMIPSSPTSNDTNENLPPKKEVSVVQNSKTIQFNSESNLSSRKRKKPCVENEENVLGQSDISPKIPSKKLSLVSTGKEIDVKNNELDKGLPPNQTVVQDSGMLQVKSERQGSSRKIKYPKFNIYSILKKCPKCGIRVRGKLSRHASSCVEKKEQDITQQSSMALETCQNILPIPSKSQSSKTTGIDIEKHNSKNRGDRCDVNEALADDGCDVRNINIAKEVIPERTVRSATESFKLNYICKEVSNRLHLKDNPYCTLCGKAFIFKSAFEAHRQLHENAGWYLCYKCGITYRNEKNLIRHCQATHSGEYVFEFEQEKSVPVGKTKGSISGSFSDKLIKKNVHKQKLGGSQAGFHDKLGHFECRQCRRIFRYQNQLKLHMERRYKVGWDKELVKIHCSLCNLKFKTRMKLKSHWKSHRNSQLFTCIVCGKAFNLQHEFLHHKCVNFKRRKCSPKKKATPEKQNVTVDAVRVKVEEETTSIAKLDDGLSNHTQVTKKNKVYQCPACRRKFENRENFAAHVVKHEKTKWYICVDCSLCFWLKEGLKEHSMYAHSENWVAEKNSPKEAKCSKFKENSPNKAKRIQVKDNSPKEASKTLVKSEVMEFICSVCGEQCSCHETFKQHVFKHENENWCICGECGNCYRDKANLVVHEKKYHDKMSDDISTSKEKKYKMSGDISTSEEKKYHKTSDNMSTSKGKKYHKMSDDISTSKGKKYHKMSDDISTSEEKKDHDEMPEDISTSEESKNSLGKNKTLRVNVERMSPCKICGVYYGTSKSEMQEHLTAHKMQKPSKLFKCTLCRKKFGNRRLLLSHRAVHSFQDKSSSNGLKERNMNSKNSYSFKLRDARLCRSVYKKGLAVSKSTVEPVSSRKSLFLRNLLLERVVKQERVVKPPNLMFSHKKITRLSAKKFVCDCCNSKFFFKGSLDNHVEKFHRLDITKEKVSKNNTSIVPD